MSLLCHPDRVANDKKEEATKKFQTLSKIHSILTDKEKRAVYDETGINNFHFSYCDFACIYKWLISCTELYEVS